MYFTNMTESTITDPERRESVSLSASSSSIISVHRLFCHASRLMEGVNVCVCVCVCVREREMCAYNEHCDKHLLQSRTYLVPVVVMLQLRQIVCSSHSLYDL